LLAGQQADVLGDGQLGREMPAGLIEQDDGVDAGGTAWEISARCRVMAVVVQRGKTRAAPSTSAGQMAPKM